MKIKLFFYLKRKNRKKYDKFTILSYIFQKNKNNFAIAIHKIHGNSEML